MKRTIWTIAAIVSASFATLGAPTTAAAETCYGEQHYFYVYACVGDVDLACERDASLCGPGGVPGCTISTPPAQANCRKACDPNTGGCA